MKQCGAGQVLSRGTLGDTAEVLRLGQGMPRQIAGSSAVLRKRQPLKQGIIRLCGKADAENSTRGRSL
jgi:hypothetical protein